MSYRASFTSHCPLVLATGVLMATVPAAVHAQFPSSERVLLNHSVPAADWGRVFAVSSGIPAGIIPSVDGATALLNHTSTAEWHPDARTVPGKQHRIGGEQALLGRVVPGRSRHEGGE